MLKSSCMEQMNSLRDTIARREGEIEKLQIRTRGYATPTPAREDSEDDSSSEMNRTVEAKHDETPLSPEGSVDSSYRSKLAFKFVKPALKPVQPPSATTTTTTTRDSSKTSPSAIKKSPNQSLLKSTGRRNWN